MDKVYDAGASGMVFFARSDLVVVDRNPENADMTNPRGEIYGEAWYIVVENSKGRRWASRRTYSDGNEADALASTYADFMADGKRLNPDNWVEIDPCYGSEAYESQGIEAQRAEEDRLDSGRRY